MVNAGDAVFRHTAVNKATLLGLDHAGCQGKVAKHVDTVVKQSLLPPRSLGKHSRLGNRCSMTYLDNSINIYNQQIFLKISK